MIKPLNKATTPLFVCIKSLKAKVDLGWNMQVKLVKLKLKYYQKYIKNDIKNDLFNFNFPKPLQFSSVVSVCDAWDRLVLL